MLHVDTGGAELSSKISNSSLRAAWLVSLVKILALNRSRDMARAIARSSSGNTTDIGVLATCWARAGAIVSVLVVNLVLGFTGRMDRRRCPRCFARLCRVLPL